MLPYIIIMDHKERLGELEWSCSVNMLKVECTQAICW